MVPYFWPPCTYLHARGAGRPGQGGQVTLLKFGAEVRMLIADPPKHLYWDSSVTYVFFVKICKLIGVKS